MYELKEHFENILLAIKENNPNHLIHNGYTQQMNLLLQNFMVKNCFWNKI